MSRPKFIDIEGKRYLWRDIVQLRREQRAAFAEAAQPPLFELRVDRRPEQQRTAAGRYLEPSLFTVIKGRYVNLRTLAQACRLFDPREKRNNIAAI